MLSMLLGVAWLAHAQWLSPGPLSKAHKEIDGDQYCQRCHASGSQVVETSCISCHKDIGAERQRKVGLHGQAFAKDACAKCHVEHLGAEVSLVRWPGTDPNRFDHAQTGFSLNGAHARTKCGECHDKRNARGAKSYLGVEKRCVSCHEDPHQKRFGERCNDCHDESSFKTLSLDGFDHDLARYPLDGAHTRVACANCHGKPPQYKELKFEDCSSCHKDPHAGRYEPTCKSCHQTESWNRLTMARGAHPGLSLANGHQATECRSCHDQGLTRAPSKGASCVGCHKAVHEAPFGERCEQCHGSIRFTGLAPSIGRDAHGRTAFPLRGEHARTDCEGCHRSELPRPARYRSLEFDQCADCHKDVHKGTLAEYGDCSTCHDPLGFAPSLVKPSTHANFGFALQGGHAAAACSACHKHPNTPRTDWHTTNKACADCHDNPHGAQFEKEMLDRGCAHCHSPEGWGLPSIDHSSWPLTGAHQSAACSACHSPNDTDRKAGHGASYRGVPRSCDGCHDDVHAGQFRSTSPARACEFCHQTEHFTLPSFDHTNLAGYVLEGKHTSTACASCHSKVHLRNGDKVTRYRLGYRQCADCHADPHSLWEGSR